MTKRTLLVAGCCLLLSMQAQAANDTAPVQGFNCVFFAPLVPAKGESPLEGIHKRLPVVAEKAGIVGHSQVELTLAPDDEKRAAEIKAALSGGRVDLLGLPASLTILGQASQFAPILDQAVATNPRMQFLIQIPGPMNIPVRDVKRLRWSGDRFHKSAFVAIVEKLRIRYPSNRIICAYYGRSGSELKTRFEAGDLPGISSLVGAEGVFRTEAGAPGPVLDDLNAMLTLSLVYNIDLMTKDLGLGYQADLGPMLKAVLKFEAKHRAPTPEPLSGEGPNIFTQETWKPPWGYTVPVTPKKGVKAFLWGHRFFTPLVEAMEPIAEKGGITDQKITSYVQKTPFDGAPGVGALRLSIPEKGSDQGEKMRGQLDTGEFDLLGLTYYQAETGKLKHYKEWFDYALARNPKTRLLIHLPSSYDPVRRDLGVLNKTGDALRAKFHSAVVQPMRKAYPDQEIIFWYSGRVNSELRRRFEEGKLPQVKQLVGPRGIFAVPGGYPGPLLKDLEGLILYSQIYKVELPKTMTGQAGKLDLNALAAEMIAMEAAKGL
ncbi:hypothetical protein ACFL34_01580 [Candidatus Sumerlaeota bacterium]